MRVSGAGAYGSIDEGARVCVCACEPAVCGNKMMGKLREMRWVCGEEDTWGRGTLPRPPTPPLPSPPVAMQLRAEKRCDSPAE